MRLIKEKVARVVVACLDPNPLVAGRGLRMLRDAGIEVETGVLESEAWQMNAGFMTRMTEQRPWVRAKVAMSLDGFKPWQTVRANGLREKLPGKMAAVALRCWRHTNRGGDGVSRSAITDGSGRGFSSRATTFESFG